MDSFGKLVSRSLARLIATREEEKKVAVEKADGSSLTPNMRALRLTMTLSDQLLSMGMPASSVVHLALGIANTYCTRKVHIDVSYNQIIISQDRGVEREPLTLIRTTAPRSTNYRTMQQLQSLAIDIEHGNVVLDDAETRLDFIIDRVKNYPNWFTYIAGGGLSAGSAILYTGSISMVILAFVVGTFVAWLIAKFAKIALPSFFTQIAASLFVTLVTAGLTWLVSQGYVNAIESINPTIITISGIVLLVAGMAIVGAFQDAIEEYYVTATARILRVAMMTMGIVLGVGIGLYITKNLGISFTVTPDRLTFASASYQYIGAVIISASFALGNHAIVTSALLTGVVGFLGYWIFLATSGLGVTTIPSYAAAGLFIGFVAALVSRAWRMPSLAVVNAGIVPLVPGLTLYNGLMGIVSPADVNDPNLLIRAILIAIAIAAGASFGLIIGRPTRRSVIALQNSLPQRKLHRDTRKEPTNNRQAS